MKDCIIIGCGPAGVSAGLYIKRANKDVLCLYSGMSSLEDANLIQNYYGFPNGISGKELYSNGIEQAKNIGIEVKNEEVVHIEKNDCFKVKTNVGEYEAKSLILAIGNKKVKPSIEGLKEFEGRGVSYCAICDGFFFRDKSVVVIGDGNFAISEAKILRNVTNNVKILTNGNQIKEKTEFEVIDKKIARISGNDKVESVEFEDGTKIDVSGVFVALGEAGAFDFAKSLGILVDGQNIKVDENMRTNIDGLYAVGNSNGGLLQVSKAVHDGAVAGLDVVKYLN